MQTVCHNIYEKQVNGLLPDYLIQIENKFPFRLRIVLVWLKKSRKFYTSCILSCLVFTVRLAIKWSNTVILVLFVVMINWVFRFTEVIQCTAELCFS